jgi:hypothetical protein
MNCNYIVLFALLGIIAHTNAITGDTRGVKIISPETVVSAYHAPDFACIGSPPPVTGTFNSYKFGSSLCSLCCSAQPNFLRLFSAAKLFTHVTAPGAQYSAASLRFLD